MTPKRKVSPEIHRVANLPAYPLPHREHPTLNTNTFPESPPKRQISSGSGARVPRTPYLSRARLQATLQSIPEPYNQICPNSLLGAEGGCEARGCELLHLCPIYNSLPDAVAEEDIEFPPLGASPAKKSVPECCCCTGIDEKVVKDGEVCTKGIHVHRSCVEEIEGAVCHFWGAAAAAPTLEKVISSEKEKTSSSSSN